MNNYIDEVKNYIPKCDQEKADRDMILSLYEMCGDKILDRNTLFSHMSASGFVLNKDFTKVLMVFHNIFKSWSWTGGHADGDANLFEVAKREVMEETGIKNLTPVSEDIISLEVLPVYKHYKNGKFVSNHLHMNLTYVFLASEDEKLIVKEDENSGVKWIDISDLDNSVNEKFMLQYYYKIIKQSKERMGL